MPTFGNVLTPSDSERLLQFLTVPYLRIPLILDFFANGDPNRITALKCHSLQCIIDAALFEPGKWRPQDDFTTISAIPEVDPKEYEKALSTAGGKLFNEISKSPDVMVTSVIKILERSLEMDVGRYDPHRASGPMILYSIRLATRVEGYMRYAVEQCDESITSSMANNTAKRPRALAR